MAMNQIHRDPKTQKMILQIHDELIFEVPDESVPEFSSWLKTTMETIVPLKVPLVVNIAVGKNWGEC